MTLTDRTRYHGSPTLAAALDELGASAANWIIDPVASTFELRGRYLFGPAVTARFKVASGAVDVADDRSDITGTLLLDAASVDSGIGLRDQHVRDRRSALDVDRYPTIRFDLDSATPGLDATFDIRGRVTIRDITRPVELRVDARVEGDHADLTATGDVDHRHFKIDFPGLGRRLTVHARLRAIAADTDPSQEKP